MTDNDKALWLWLGAGGAGCLVLVLAILWPDAPSAPSIPIQVPASEEATRHRAATPRELPMVRRATPEDAEEDLATNTGRPIPIRPMHKMRTAIQLAQPTPLAAPIQQPLPQGQPAQQGIPPDPQDTPPPKDPPTGTLDSAAIKTAVQAVLPDVKNCYETGLKMKADSKGTVKVSFTLVASDGGGFMRDAELLDSELANPVVDSCILEALSQAHFPMPQGGGEVRVTYPFKFDQ